MAGELRLDGRPADRHAVAEMGRACRRRGPDGAGTWASGSVALAHHRLAVIDPSPRSAQPMADEELGLAVVLNGCLYNHGELRERLRGLGYRFATTGDTEVLLKGWHAWGERLLDVVEGEYAFAVADVAGRLVLARDPLGVKPLYVEERPGRLRFASTVPALVAGGGVDTTVDAVALHAYLTFHGVVPPPRTILAGVRKLAPGSLLVAEPGSRPRQRTFWSPAFIRDPDRERWTPREWAEALGERLRAAARRRMVADVPVGVLLSGGLDSSLVVALLAEQSPPPTFTIAVEGADESGYAELVARRLGTRHERVEASGADVLAAVPGAVAAMNEPLPSHDAVAFWLLARVVRRTVKVVQTGQGADEVLGGYHWHRPMLSSRGLGLDDYAASTFDRSAAEVADAVAPEYLAGGDPSRAFAERHFLAPGAATPADRALRFDATVTLPADPLQRVDGMAMAAGVEARVPFCDPELVELAAACPPTLKIAGGGKPLLRIVAHGIVPRAIVQRPKWYFPVPALTRPEGPLLDLVRDALFAPEAKDRGLFRPEHIDRLLAEPQRTPLNASKLWQLGLLELWFQTHRIK